MEETSGAGAASAATPSSTHFEKVDSTPLSHNAEWQDLYFVGTIERSQSAKEATHEGAVASSAVRTIACYSICSRCMVCCARSIKRANKSMRSRVEREAANHMKTVPR